MASNRKVRADRIIIILLSMVIIIAVLGFGISKLIDVLFNNENNPINKPDIVDPTPIKTNETTKVSLIDYQIYEDDTKSLGFDFIIASLKFEDENNISFDLGNLQTSEKGVVLNNVSKYLNTLHENAYNIESLNIVNTVVSDSKNYTCNVFIPFTTDENSLRIYNSLDASMFEIDLTKNLNNVTAIKFETEKDIIIGDTNVRVSKSYISNMMMHNGVEFDASGMNYYTFNIYVEQVEDNVKIIDAAFIPNNSNEQLKALNTQYRSAKVDNCLDKVLTVGENGALFFEGSSKNEDSLKGYLMLMFSNSDEWVKISTVLE